VVENLDNNGIRYMVEGDYREEAEEGSDMDAIIKSYVSVGIVDNVGSR
jgi:5'-nucleotidase